MAAACGIDRCDKFVVKVPSCGTRSTRACSDPYKDIFFVADFAAKADFDNSDFDDNDDIVLSGDDVEDGIYYSTGKILVDNVGGSGSFAKLTLVAKGTVEYKGNNYIEPAVNGEGVIAFSDYAVTLCSNFGVMLPSDFNVLKGLIYAKEADVQWSGKENILDKGSVVAVRVQLNGDDHLIVADDSGPADPPDMDHFE
jgi:hypothetical protein